MVIIYILLLIAFILTILLFAITLRVRVVFDTYGTGINLNLSWLHAYIKALVTIENTKPMLTVYLFNKKVFEKLLKKDKGKISSMDFIKLVDSKDVCVNVSYGFQDPYTTGIACGAISAASQFINIDYFDQKPDFTTGSDYVYLDANAKVNIGSTLIRLFKFKSIS